MRLQQSLQTMKSARSITSMDQQASSSHRANRDLIFLISCTRAILILTASLRVFLEDLLLGEDDSKGAEEVLIFAMT